MKTYKLKPCPFCGNKPILQKIPWENENHYGTDIFVACYSSKCKITPSTQQYPRIDYAILAWNRRAK